MEEHQSADSVLILSDELLPDEATAGHDAVAKEPGVLLLDDEMPPEPVIKKIEVGPRVSGAGKVADSGERQPSHEVANAAPVAQTSGRQRKAVWQGGLPVKPAATFIRRDQQGSGPTSADRPDYNELARSLAEARAFAADYGAMRARTRMALYDALGRTYDLTIHAEAQPEQFAELVEQAGLTSTDRAPFTPIVKLVFGAEYDKTRVAEFAAAIAYGRRRDVPIRKFTAYLETVEGGLKAVVGFERLIRKGEVDPAEAGPQVQPRPAIARKLRELRPTAWNELPGQGDEFTLLVARRLPDGTVAMVGEVPRDIALLEKAARRLLAERGHISSSE